MKKSYSIFLLLFFFLKKRKKKIGYGSCSAFTDSPSGVHFIIYLKLSFHPVFHAGTWFCSSETIATIFERCNVVLFVNQLLKATFMWYHLVTFYELINCKPRPLSPYPPHHPGPSDDIIINLYKPHPTETCQMVKSPSRRGKPCNSLTGFLTFPSNFRLLYWQIYSKHKPNKFKDLSKPDIETVKLQSIKILVITWRNYHEETRHESSPHLTPRLLWICKAKPENPPPLQANHAFKYRKNPRHTPSSPGVEVRWSGFQLISGLFSKPNN